MLGMTQCSIPNGTVPFGLASFPGISGLGMRLPLDGPLWSGIPLGGASVKLVSLSQKVLTNMTSAVLNSAIAAVTLVVYGWGIGNVIPNPGEKTVVVTRSEEGEHLDVFQSHHISAEVQKFYLEYRCGS